MLAAREAHIIRTLLHPQLATDIFDVATQIASRGVERRLQLSHVRAQVAQLILHGGKFRSLEGR